MTRNIRTRLALLAFAVTALLPLGVHAAQAHPTLTTDPNYGHHWACVGEIDINIGICIDNPIPPPPY